MIFPFVEPEEETVSDLPTAKEWAWDFERNDFAYINNKPYLVEGKEAVKIWAFKALNTERFKHEFYSWDYGSEVNRLIGSGLTKEAIEIEIERLVEEALLTNEYITGINNFNAQIQDDSLSVELTIETVYGETEVGFSAN